MVEELGTAAVAKIGTWAARTLRALGLWPQPLVGTKLLCLLQQAGEAAVTVVKSKQSQALLLPVRLLLQIQHNGEPFRRGYQAAAYPQLQLQQLLLLLPFPHAGELPQFVRCSSCCYV